MHFSALVLRDLKSGFLSGLAHARTLHSCYLLFSVSHLLAESMGKMCHFTGLFLFQNLELNSQCCAGYPGKPVCSLIFLQVFPCIWDSPLIDIYWNQHCSRQAATSSSNATSGTLLSFSLSHPDEGYWETHGQSWEKPLRLLTRVACYRIPCQRKG